MTPKRKRLIRFSLSTFFVLITILCVLLGLKVRQVHLQRQATAWVLDHGGTISYDYQVSFPPSVSEGHLGPPGREWLRAIVGDDFFASPHGVQFLREPVGDLSQLRNLPTLKTLAIYGEDVNDVTPLAELQKLEALGLRCGSDCDISPLKNLKDLRLLTVCGISDSQLEELRKSLPDCRISIMLFPELMY